MNTQPSLKYIGVFTLFAGLFLFAASCASQTTATDPRAVQVAEALTESGAKFYGAFWCPHCSDQKELFGSAADKLPYTECSTPDRRSQTQVCVAAGVKAYPTWEFPDGTRYEGVLSLDQLVEKAGLSLPSSENPGPVSPS